MIQLLHVIHTLYRYKPVGQLISPVEGRLLRTGNLRPIRTPAVLLEMSESAVTVNACMFSAKHDDRKFFRLATRAPTQIDGKQVRPALRRRRRRR